MITAETKPSYFRSYFVRFRWIIPTLLFFTAVYLLACEAPVDRYGRYPGVISNLFIYFLRYGLAPLAILSALAYAKNFKDLLVNLILVFIPMFIITYPLGWAILNFLSAKWRVFYGESVLMFLVFPIFFAKNSLITSILLGVGTAAGLQWGLKKKGDFFPLANLIAREINFWCLTLYFLACCTLPFA